MDITTQALETAINAPINNLLVFMAIVTAVGGVILGVTLARVLKPFLGALVDLLKQSEKRVEKQDARLDGIEGSMQQIAPYIQQHTRATTELTGTLVALRADISGRLSLIEGSLNDRAKEEQDAFSLLPVLRDKANALQISVDGLSIKLKAEIADALKGILEELKNFKVEMQDAKRPCDMLEQLLIDVRALVARIESAASADDEEDTVQLKPIQENPA